MKNLELITFTPSFKSAYISDMNDFLSINLNLSHIHSKLVPNFFKITTGYKGLKEERNFKNDDEKTMMYSYFANYITN
jgi:hypothetical protein